MSANNHILINFAHANGFPAASYNAMFSQLAPNTKVIAKPKYAHSQRFPVSKDWQMQAEELIDYVKANADQPVYAVGHSFGGVISYMAACQQPSLFKGLIMLEPPLVTGITRRCLKMVRYTPLFNRFTPAKQARTRCISWPLDTDLVAYFSRKALFKNMHLTCIQDYVSSAIEQTDKQFSLSFSHNVEADIFNNVPLNINQFYGKLAVPGLLVTAQNSRVCKPALINPFLKHNHLTHSQALECGHMFPLEKPQWTAELIHNQIVKWEEALSD